ncbi:hypothetical protein QVD17_07493 [Tagetes erecta]|uniref:Uncharacterized protein n=1 Tax=Tagetes erecta TaxID=13708 RepID=A0AAD8K186_TARER|nr:hypothetical protein QVD17_35333 [Tagetes erecta]KAK1441525.1 hypothetical protein QVD17_07493 [Tagetes erecta]
MSDNNNYPYMQDLSDQNSINNPMNNPLMPGAQGWPIEISSEQLMPEAPVEGFDENEVNSHVTLAEPWNVAEFDPNDWTFTPSPSVVLALPVPHGEGTSRPRIQVNSTQELFSAPPIERNVFASEYPIENHSQHYPHHTNEENPVDFHPIEYLNDDYKRIFTGCMADEIKVGMKLVKIAKKLRKIGEDLMHK